MRNATIRLAICLMLSIIFISAANANTSHYDRKESLKGKWRFSLGDNMKFARPSYDDARWEEINVPSSWEREGFRHYDGFAWYRKDIRMDLTSGENLYLHLGKIDDVDEVYLNGHLIGSSGGFPPKFVTAYDQHRVYHIPKEYAKKTGNVLAIRVYDNEGPGGLMSYKIGVYEHYKASESVYDISGNWKFHLNDDLEWAKPSFDDSQWENIIVPATWDSQGYEDYDGIAWYRKTIRLPENVSANEMMLIVGKIDDMDEVFVNGVRIGGTGDFDFVYRGRGYQEEWNKKRNYSIPDGVLKPGGRNVIAVRVYDHHEKGGIYRGPISIIPVNQYRSFQEYRRSDIDDFIDVVEWIENIFD